MRTCILSGRIGAERQKIFYSFFADFKAIELTQLKTFWDVSAHITSLIQYNQEVSSSSLWVFVVCYTFYQVDDDLPKRHAVEKKDEP